MQTLWRRLLTPLALTAVLLLSALNTSQAAPANQNADTDGVLVVSVGADTPAADAAIVRGDIILSINNNPVDDAQALANAILEQEPGSDLLIELLHGDEVLEVTVTLGDRAGVAFLGILPYQDEATRSRMPLRPLRPDAATPVPREEPDADATGEEADSDVAESAQEPEMDPAEPEDEGQTDGQRDSSGGSAEADNDTATAAGALIMEVADNSPAAEAGIEPGDLIIRVGGEEVNVDNDLAQLVGQYAPGDEISITIYDPASDDEMTLIIILGENPTDSMRPFLGVAYTFAQDATTSPAPQSTPLPQKDGEEDSADGGDAGDELFVPEGDGMIMGALVGDVLAGSPADQAGIQTGDLIVAIEDEQVSEESDLAALIGQYAPGDEIGISLFDPMTGEEVTVVVQLGKNPSDAMLPFLGIRYIPVPALPDGRAFPLLPQGGNRQVDPPATPAPSEETGEGATGSDDVEETAEEMENAGTDSPDEDISPSGDCECTRHDWMEEHHDKRHDHGDDSSDEHGDHHGNHYDDHHGRHD